MSDEYPECNATRQYPLYTNNFFAKGLLLDAVWWLSTEYAFCRLRLDRIELVSLSDVEFDVAVVDVDNVVVATFTFIAPYVGTNVLFLEDTGIQGKIVFGNVLPTLTAPINATGVFFVDCNVRTHNPKVQFEVANTDNPDHILTPVATITEGEMIWSDGANNAFTFKEGSVDLRVAGGLGTGLYDDCDVDGTIRKINNITGTSRNNNFFFTVGPCYNLIYGENAIGLANNCSPRCKPEFYTGVADFTNLIKTRQKDLVDYAATVWLELKDRMESHLANEHIARGQLTLKANMVKTTFFYTSVIWYSLTAFLFNPTNEPVTATISGNTPAVRGSSFYGVGGVPNTENGSSNTTPSLEIPCRSYLVLRYATRDTTTTFTAGNLQVTV